MTERETRRNQDFSRRNLTEIAVDYLKRYGRLSHYYEIPVFKQGNWERIAELVRDNTLDFQVEFAVNFFGRRGADFPNGESLAAFLVGVNNIRWFRPLEPPDPRDLQDRIDAITQSLGMSPKRLLLIENDWEQINIPNFSMEMDKRIELMENTMAQIIKELKRTDPVLIASAAARGCARVALNIARQQTSLLSSKAKSFSTIVAKRASIFARFGAYAIIIEDQVLRNKHGSDSLAEDFAATIGGLSESGTGWKAIKHELKDLGYFDPSIRPSNPAERVLSIYELGGAPIGVTETEFLVFWPPISR